MRRLILIALLLPAVVFGGTGLLAAPPAVAQLPPDDPGRGLVYSGLRPAGPDSPCRENFELPRGGGNGRGGPPSCTHGPDPAPPGVDVRRHRDPAEIAAETEAAPVTAAATTGIQCYRDSVNGPGTSGNRVQAIYAHTGASSLATLRPTFEQAAATADFNINASAAETGGVRHVRFVTDASCNLVIADVTLSTGSNPDMDTMIADLKAKGYGSPNRKYLVWMDATNYCGIGDLFVDESPDQSNDNNGEYAQYARIDNSCWNRTGASVETHELTHTLGSVQPGAPHRTVNYHCTDESDRMCYDDGPPAVALTQVCPPFHEQRLDCRHDDYFSTSPPPGNYLATHWNTANSGFLSATGPAYVAPRQVPTDFDANAATNPSVFRPSNGNWFSKTATGTATANYGTNGDIPVPADYDGDRKTDIAVYRPSSGTWYIRWSSNGTEKTQNYGVSTDVPVPADYDDDGATDIAVFRPSNGTWFIRPSAGGVNETVVSYGTTGDVPVPEDYNGDGRADQAVFRPSSGVWYVRLSGGGDSAMAWGTSGDVPVPGDYDGDARADRGVFRPSSGQWFVNGSGGAQTGAGFGTSGDVPVPGDYNGDKLTDIAVFRPSNGVWYTRNSGGTDTAVAFGVSTDIPLPLAPAIRRALFP